MQGRAAYGGLVACLALRSIRAIEDALPPLRVVNVSFIAPATEEIAFRPRMLRRGRHVTQMDAEVVDARGSLVCRVDAVFGSPRQSTLSWDAPKPQTIGTPEDLISIPQIPGLTPRFLGHMDMRLAAGAPPFAGQSEAFSKGWVRLKETGPLGEEQLLCLADCWWSPALVLASTPVPASSLRWTAHFSGANLSDFEGHLWSDSSCVRSSDGYVVQVARFWAGTTLAAWSEQSQVVFG